MSNIYKCKKCGIPFFHCNSCKAWHSECICVNGQRQIIYDKPKESKIKTDFSTLKKLYGLARNNNFKAAKKELSVKISGRTKYNHELSQLYLDICNKYNHSKQMKWKDLYKILEELTKDKQIEL